MKRALVLSLSVLFVVSGIDSIAAAALGHALSFIGFWVAAAFFGVMVIALAAEVNDQTTHAGPTYPRLHGSDFRGKSGPSDDE